MAELDASESIVNLVDLSDQIDAELSGKGAAYVGLRVYRYNRTYMNRTAPTAMKRLPKTISRAEPKMVAIVWNLSGACKTQWYAFLRYT